MFAPMLSFAQGPPQKADAKPDYTEFSRVIHKVAVSRVPRFVEDNSGWGHTVPIPPDLRLPRLRTMVKVGDRLELPDGLWRKVRVSIKDPDKDIKIRVVDFKKLDNKKFRLALDIDGAASTTVEAQQWQKGLLLIGFNADADVTVGAYLECDVGVTLATVKFPPELKIEPAITTLKTRLNDFNLRQVSLRRLGKVLDGEKAKEIGNQYKGILEEVLHAFEPQIKDLANQAIAQSLKEGKGTVSADAIFKMMNAAGKQQKDAK
jgi:hypothetical protein